ncbi:MAG: NADH-quinone oxidoreductase subunit C [Burkholderiales bacterium]|nr:NADH-quinone oxidoreductase subunit C [Burkholderiales bacterium]
MSVKLAQLKSNLAARLEGKFSRLSEEKGQLILEVKPADLVVAMTMLRDDASLGFSQLVDVCGVDYSEYGGNWDGPRFAAVYHLLSVEHNWRVRVKAFCANDDLPMVDSMVDIWSSANWFEREAFDLFGIVFAGHPDLRRILTDYGFVGHPFRKDFPVYGNVEMRYDAEQRRVVYQPVTIEPREIVPRVIREDNYAGRK